MNTKTKNILNWTLTGLVAFILTASAITKLIGGEQAIEMAKGLGGMTNVTLLGFLELFIVALWIIPRTGIVGALLAIAYIGGAMAVHFIYNQSILVPIVIQMVIWLVTAYRFPELTRRVLNRA